MTNLKIDGRKILVKKSESVTKMRDKLLYEVQVTNLSYDTDQNDLKEFFKANDIEKIKEIQIAKDENGNSLGFAYVDLESKEDLQKSLKIQSKEIKNRSVVIRISKRITKVTNNKGEGSENSEEIYKKEYAGRKRKIDLSSNENVNNDHKMRSEKYFVIFNF